MRRFPNNPCIDALNLALLAGFPLPSAYDPSVQQIDLVLESVREESGGHWEWDHKHPELAGEIDWDKPDVDPLGVRLEGQLQVHSTGSTGATTVFRCYSMREIISQFRINGVI